MIKKTIAYFQLIRIQNLFIIALMQYMTRWYILNPILQKEGFTLQMSELIFGLFVLSTVLIAAAGYVTNDYFDIRIDHINKPDKIIVGRLVSRRKAILLHYIFNGIACIVGFYVAYKVGSLKIGFFFPMIAMLMWFYSIKYKRMFLTGNLVIAFLSAFVIIVVWLFEFFALKSNGMLIIAEMKNLQKLLYGFSLFAFIISLVREIVKDIEDLEGDQKVGCRTVPVVIGVNKTKMLAASLLFLVVGALVYLQFYFANFQILRYYIFCLIALSAYVAIQILRANTKEDFALSTNFIKILMIAGILSLQVMVLKI